MPQPVPCWKMPRVEASSLHGRSAGVSVCTGNSTGTPGGTLVCIKDREATQTWGLMTK